MFFSSPCQQLRTFCKKPAQREFKFEGARRDYIISFLIEIRADYLRALPRAGEVRREMNMIELLFLIFDILVGGGTGGGGHN